MVVVGLAAVVEEVAVVVLVMAVVELVVALAVMTAVLGVVAFGVSSSSILSLARGRRPTCPSHLKSRIAVKYAYQFSGVAS